MDITGAIMAIFWYLVVCTVVGVIGTVVAVYYLHRIGWFD